MSQDLHGLGPRLPCELRLAELRQQLSCTNAQWFEVGVLYLPAPIDLLDNQLAIGLDTDRLSNRVLMLCSGEFEGRFDARDKSAVFRLIVRHVIPKFESFNRFEAQAISEMEAAVPLSRVSEGTTVEHQKNVAISANSGQKIRPSMLQIAREPMPAQRSTGQDYPYPVDDCPSRMNYTPACACASALALASAMTVSVRCAGTGW